MLFRQIKYFQAILDNGSFSEAAAACGISQSAISQQMQALEKDLGVKLFDRSRRKCTLTSAGEHFYKRSLVIIADLEQLRREISQIDHTESVLRLGYILSYTGDAFHSAIADFAEKYPDVKLQVTSGSRDELFDALRNGSLDLILNDRRRSYTDLFEEIVLAKTSCSVEISAHNPLAKLDCVEVDDLKNTVLILISAPGQETVETLYYREKVGFSGEITTVPTAADARVLVAANRGVLAVETLRNSGIESTVMKRIPLVRKGEPIERTYCAYYKKANAGLYVSLFADILRGVYDKLDKNC